MTESSGSGATPLAPQHPGTPPAARPDTDVVFDPATYTAGVPFDVLARLRRDDPVAWVPEVPVLGWPAGPGFWLVLRHADVESVLRRPGFAVASNPAKFLRANMLAGTARDDVAILTLKLLASVREDPASDGTRRLFRWRYERIDRDVALELRQRLARTLDEHGFDREAIDDLIKNGVVRTQPKA